MLKEQMKYNLTPKWWSVVIWVLAAIILCGNQLNSQTYTVGDTVDTFGAEVCVNGDGYWDYDTDGLNKITWINIFTSW